MLHKLLVILHLLGAAVWVGGHITLVGAILPAALRARDPERIRDFERSYGRIGLGSLALQTVTGLWLATMWVGDWRTIFTDPAPAAHLILAKVVLLIVTVGLAGHAYHRILPRMTSERMRPFAVHAWATTVISILMIIAGASIRFGGLF